MKHNPDDRSDNVERIQENIDNTIEKLEDAEELIEITDNSKTRHDLEEKNDKRRQALDSMKSEIRDEAQDRNME